ncbi:MAG: PDZ domain-containing protein [Gemmatimonadetes bacterium]|nr:PDZ domain-containing protein [Gemmatimonadota bacterium]
MRLPRRSLALTAALGALALGALPVTGAAQAAARGWVGMSLHIEETLSAAGRHTRVLVKGVSEGSPAAKAGVEAGDLLVRVNGHGVEDQFGGITQTLKAGEAVTVVVERNGKRLRMKMTAAARPADVPEALPWTPSLGSDSMADAMFRAMDSLRLRLIEGGSGSVGVLTLPGSDDMPVSGNLPAPGRIVLRRADGSPAGVFGPPGSDSVTVQLLPEVRPPFSFFVFPGDRSDSLQSEMAQLNGEIRELRARQAERLRQLAAELPQGQQGVETRDPELQSLTRALDAAGRRAVALRSAMARAARDHAGGTYAVADGEVTGQSTEPANQATFRPLAPYLLGQDRAAGAEVVSLRPELAAYFQVDGGVLVVDVPAGTPAALAGVQPGDVVTEVNGAPIHSIEQLRLGLSRQGSEPLTLTLVRRGRTLKVHLPH